MEKLRVTGVMLPYQGRYGQPPLRRLPTRLEIARQTATGGMGVVSQFKLTIDSEVCGLCSLNSGASL